MFTRVPRFWPMAIWTWWRPSKSSKPARMLKMRLAMSWSESFLCRCPCTGGLKDHRSSKTFHHHWGGDVLWSKLFRTDTSRFECPRSYVIYTEQHLTCSIMFLFVDYDHDYFHFCCCIVCCCYHWCYFHCSYVSSGNCNWEWPSRGMSQRTWPRSTFGITMNSQAVDCLSRPLLDSHLVWTPDRLWLSAHAMRARLSSCCHPILFSTYCACRRYLMTSQNSK